MSEDRSIEEIREQKRERLQGEPSDERAAGNPSEPVHVGGRDELAAVVEDNDVVLVDFYADWCGPCKMIEPVVAEIAAETDAAVAKVDIDANRGLASEYAVQGVPTLLLFAGGEPAERMVGVKPKAALVEAIERHG